MRTLLLLAIVALAMPARADEAPKSGRVPLNVCAAGVLPNDELVRGPLIKIGSPSADWPAKLRTGLERDQFEGLSMPPVPDGPDPALTKMATDPWPKRWPMSLANDAAPTYLLLVSPALDLGKAFAPAELWRDGETFKLVIDQWDDNIPRKKNVIAQQGYLISLGALPEGQYDLRVEWRRMMMDEKSRSPLYHYDALQVGVTRFEVHKPGWVDPTPATQPRAWPGIFDNQFRPAEVPADAKGQLWQPPYRAMRQLSSVGRSKSLLLAGTFDADEWLTEIKDSLIERPDLKPPPAGDRLYAYVEGPPMERGQWMALREIIWLDAKHVQVRVELWIDFAPRSKNYTYTPAMLVQLHPPRNPASESLAPGECQVSVEWLPLYAKDIGGIYRLGKPQPLDRTTFTIK